MNEVSLELPEYLRTTYSITTSKSVRISHKPLKTPLSQGISIEAPDFFKISQVRIISPSSRKNLLQADGPLLSDLKKFRITSSKGFNYCDFFDSNYDFDSLPFKGKIRLKADKNPRLKKSGGYFKRYEEELQEGFGRTRGEFSVEGNNPKVLREHPKRAKNLEDLLRKTTKERFLSRESRTPTEGKRVVGVSHLVKRVSTAKKPNPLEELDTFEARLPKSQSLADKRKIYSFLA